MRDGVGLSEAAWDNERKLIACYEKRAGQFSAGLPKEFGDFIAVGSHFFDLAEELDAVIAWVRCSVVMATVQDIVRDTLRKSLAGCVWLDRQVITPNANADDAFTTVETIRDFIFDIAHFSVLRVR